MMTICRARGSGPERLRSRLECSANRFRENAVIACITIQQCSFRDLQARRLHNRIRTVGGDNRQSNLKRFPQGFRGGTTEYLVNQPQRRRVACLDQSASPSSRLGPAAEKTHQAPATSLPCAGQRSLWKRPIETPEPPNVPQSESNRQRSLGQSKSC